MCLLARGDKRTGAIYGSRHNRFHLLRRHRNRIKMQPPTKSFHRNLTSLAARCTRSSSPRGGTALWPAFNPLATPVWPGIDRTTYIPPPTILPSPFLKLDHVSALPRGSSSSRKFSSCFPSLIPCKRPFSPREMNLFETNSRGRAEFFSFNSEEKEEEREDERGSWETRKRMGKEWWKVGLTDQRIADFWGWNSC